MNNLIYEWVVKVKSLCNNCSCTFLWPGSAEGHSHLLNCAYSLLNADCRSVPYPRYVLVLP